MLVNYGHAKISWAGEDYILTPSFSNIAKLGKPKEIIDKFKRFISLGDCLAKWHLAISVLDACCDKQLPDELVGHTVFSEQKQRFLYKQPAHGMPMFYDCITFADHCLRHGICGVYESDDEESNAKPVEEFDAYWFMEMAMEHLEVSREDAATMTMTEFARRMAVKFPPKKDETKATKKESRELQAWFEQNNGVH